MAGNPFLKKKLVEEKQTIKQQISQPQPPQPKEEMVDEEELEEDEEEEKMTIKSPIVEKEEVRPKRSIQRMPLSKEEVAYILKNYDKKTLANIARDLGVKPSKINNFIKSLKENLKKVIQSPDASKEDKIKAKKKLEFLENMRVKGEFGPQRKSDKDRASIYDDIFNEILK
ncbi:MAG: hypothetical protein QXD03_05380 [Candidatus Anstonellales archaeon]